MNTPYSTSAPSFPDATETHPNATERPATERVAAAKSMREGKKTGKQLIGTPVISLDDGTEIGQVHDVIFNARQGNLVGVTIPVGGGFFGGGKTLLLRSAGIFALGEDAITVQNSNVLEEISRKIEEFGDEAGEPVLGKRLMTDDGSFLGRIDDILVDRTTRKVVAYEVSGGLWNDLMRGQTDVPIEHITAIGRDVVIVPAAIKDMVQETTGGLIGQAQIAAEKVNDARTAASEKIEDKEIDYSLGKVAGHDVTDDNNSIIVRQGETITEQHIQRALATNKVHALAIAAGRQHAMEIGQSATETVKEKVGSAQESLKDKQGEMLVGKTVGRDVLLENGMPLITAGSTITEAQVATAREAGKLGDLTTAVVASALNSAKETVGEKYDAAKESLDQRRAEADVNKPVLNAPATGTVIQADTVIVQESGTTVVDPNRSNLL
ncbi:MAG: hypothetical protein C4320_02095 [Armatimonadota bacterium]